MLYYCITDKQTNLPFGTYPHLLGCSLKNKLFCLFAMLSTNNAALLYLSVNAY